MHEEHVVGGGLVGMGVEKIGCGVRTVGSGDGMGVEKIGLGVRAGPTGEGRLVADDPTAGRPTAGRRETMGAVGAGSGPGDGSGPAVGCAGARATC